MGTCGSVYRKPNGFGPSLLSSPASVETRRLSLNRKSYTVRSPSKHVMYVDTPIPVRGLQTDATSISIRKRRNSMTVAATTRFSHQAVSTLAASSSYSETTSANLSGATSRNSTFPEKSKLESVLETAQTLRPESPSSSDIANKVETSDIPVVGKPLKEGSPGFPHPTARERLFGTFEHRSFEFKAFYSRPEAFRYESSPYFKTVDRRFHLNMHSNTLSTTVSKQRGFELQSDDVQVPEGNSENQWLGKHVIHFYNSISVFYHRISRLCTPETCPKMHAGSQIEYKWQNDKGQIRAVAAPKYIRLLFAWIEKQISDPNIFPFPIREQSLNDSYPTPMSGHYVDFPTNFRTIAVNILRRIWRVIAHLYYGHFKRIRSIGLEDELNFRFYHLAFFVLRFELLPSAELRPLRSLIVMRLPEELTSRIEW